MTAADRYVIVPADGAPVIVGGPLLWDGDGDFDPGAGRMLKPEADALAAGEKSVTINGKTYFKQLE